MCGSRPTLRTFCSSSVPSPWSPRQSRRRVVDAVQRTGHDAAVAMAATFDMDAFDDALEHIDRRLIVFWRRHSFVVVESASCAPATDGLKSHGAPRADPII